MLVENQVYADKPCNHRMMFIEEVKRENDNETYSATIIDYEEMTITKVVDQDVNDLWFKEWWILVTEEGVWEQQIDNFAKWLKVDATKVHEKHEENIAKDKEFFQSVVGNTYKRVFGEQYILVLFFPPEQPFEHERRFDLGLKVINCEMGKTIEYENRRFPRNGFEAMYKPCEYEEFVKAKDKMSSMKEIAKNERHSRMLSMMEELMREFRKERDEIQVNRQSQESH